MTTSFEIIKKILSEKFGVSQDIIILQSELTSDLNLSNLEISDLISILTTEFELKLPLGYDMTKIITVADMVNLTEIYGEEL